VPIGKATISYLTLVGFLFLSACERAPRERRLPVPDLRGGEPSIELDPDAPLDPRVIPLVPDGLVGTDRLCDLSFVGEPAPSRGAHRLPEGILERRIVRCFASTGEGVPGLAQRIADHRAHLAAAGRLEEARRRRVRAEVLALLGAQLRRAWEERQERAVNDILAGRSTPAAEVRRLWATGA